MGKWLSRDVFLLFLGALLGTQGVEAGSTSLTIIREERAWFPELVVRWAQQTPEIKIQKLDKLAHTLDRAVDRLREYSDNPFAELHPLRVLTDEVFALLFMAMAQDPDPRVRMRAMGLLMRVTLGIARPLMSLPPRSETTGDPNQLRSEERLTAKMATALLHALGDPEMRWFAAGACLRYLHIELPAGYRSRIWEGIQPYLRDPRNEALRSSLAALVRAATVLDPEEERLLLEKRSIPYMAALIKRQMQTPIEEFFDAFAEIVNPNYEPKPADITPEQLVAVIQGLFEIVAVGGMEQQIQGKAALDKLLTVKEKGRTRTSLLTKYSIMHGRDYLSLLQTHGREWVEEARKHLRLAVEAHPVTKYSLPPPPPELAEAYRSARTYRSDERFNALPSQTEVHDKLIHALHEAAYRFQITERNNPGEFADEPQNSIWTSIIEQMISAPKELRRTSDGRFGKWLDAVQLAIEMVQGNEGIRVTRDPWVSWAIISQAIRVTYELTLQIRELQSRARTADRGLQMLEFSVAKVFGSLVRKAERLIVAHPDQLSFANPAIASEWMAWSTSTRNGLPYHVRLVTEARLEELRRTVINPIIEFDTYALYVVQESYQILTFYPRRAAWALKQRMHDDPILARRCSWMLRSPEGYDSPIPIGTH